MVISSTDLTGHSQEIVNCGDIINRSYRTQPGNHQLWWYHQQILPDTARKSSIVVISSTDLTRHSQEIVNCGDIINQSYRTQPGNRQLWWYRQLILPDTARKSSIVVISSTDLTGHSQEIINCGDIINRSYRTQPGNCQLWWYHQPILLDTARKSSIVEISSTDLTGPSQEIVNCGDIINQSFRTQPGNRQLWWYHQPILPDTARKSSIVVISSTDLTGHSQEIVNCGDIINSICEDLDLVLPSGFEGVHVLRCDLRTQYQWTSAGLWHLRTFCSNASISCEFGLLLLLFQFYKFMLK